MYIVYALAIKRRGVIKTTSMNEYYVTMEEGWGRGGYRVERGSILGVNFQGGVKKLIFKACLWLGRFFGQISCIQEV